MNCRAATKTSDKRNSMNMSYDAALIQKLHNCCAWLQKLEPIIANPALAQRLLLFATDDRVQVFKSWFLDDIREDLMAKGVFTIATRMMADNGLSTTSFTKEELDRFCQYISCFNAFIRSEEQKKFNSDSNPKKRKPEEKEEKESKQEDKVTSNDVETAPNKRAKV